MGLCWSLNSITQWQVKTVEVIKMEGVLYASKIVVVAKILAGGTNIPVLKRSSFIGAVKSWKVYLLLTYCKIIGY
jgi:hypothetical protein